MVLSQPGPILTGPQILNHKICYLTSGSRDQRPFPHHLCCKEIFGLLLCCEITCQEIKHYKFLDSGASWGSVGSKGKYTPRISTCWYENELLAFPGWKGPNVVNMSLDDQLCSLRNGIILRTVFLLLRECIIGCSSKISLGQWESMWLGKCISSTRLTMATSF